MRARLILLLTFIFAPSAVFTSSFGVVRGVVHDPQHRPIQGAAVTLKAKSSDWSKSTNTNDAGEFQFNGVPLGEYSVTVNSTGFTPNDQDVTVISSMSR